MEYTKSVILSNEEIAKDIFKLKVKFETLPEIEAGQFLSVKIPNRKDLLLNRPFGISDFNTKANTIDFCFQIRGEGTKVLSTLKEGDNLEILYPLGNGFFLGEQKKIMLLSGGIGAFPLNSIFQKYKNQGKEFYSFMGFKNKDMVVFEREFRDNSKEIFITTDDGSAFEKGFITDKIDSEIDRIKPDILLACGPLPMFKALKSVLSHHMYVPTFISMEERMGCGVGACLVCTCKVNVNGSLNSLRVCRDGPVFDMWEVEL